MATQNKRLLKLKSEILDVKGKWSLERADIYTKAYEQFSSETGEVLRARALAKYLDEKTIYIKDGELVVGNYGAGIGAYEIYPEYSFQDAVIRYIHFDTEREVSKDEFDTKEEQEKFEEIYKFWQGKTMRERVDQVFPEYVKKLRDLDICCNPYGRDEGQGHVAVQYDRVINEGLRAIIDQAQKQMEVVFDKDPIAYDFLKAVVISLEAAVRFANRYADEAEKLAKSEKDITRKNELLEIAENCRKVPEYPAENFAQACQAVWFIHLILHSEQNGFSISIGRFDQYAYPFFKADLEKGIAKEKLFEVLECFWLKFSEITIGGIKISLTQTVTLCGKDKHGNDMTNELSHMCLNASRDLMVLNPQILVRYHDQLDREIVQTVLEAVKGNESHMAFFNDDVVVDNLVEYGVAEEDAYEYGQCGCNETEIPGKMIGGGLPRPLFLLRVVELAVFGGVWRYTGEQIGPKTKRLDECKTYEEFLDGYKTQYNHFIKYISYAANTMDYLHSQYTPLPFASSLMNGCIERGRDLLIQTDYFYYTLGCNDFVAAVNNIAAIKKAVFDDVSVKPDELLLAIENNYVGYERMRALMLNTPKFGNDDDYVDSIVTVVENISSDAIKDLRSFRNNAPWFCECIPRISHVYEGIVTKATPDGRLDKDTLPPGISAQIGTDTNGPTALLNSISKINQKHFVGGVISNLRLHNNLLNTQESYDKTMSLIRAYFKRGGMHLQLNCVDKETLLKAQQKPEDYKDLMVRVSGYIDYFTNMDEASQADIIKRTEHEL